ncbi:GntR family transcriptional regulator [Corynebacterium glyciniphilum]|uniref:Putative transcriptional regulator, GntR-family n=1 Tax=Corynebacterium glyciniphilum AJ 3170 TaxID=1404245 RepID=X5DI20_9CORY|nr:GntR family transcriptional regulator [Corynebacterium glyciniphilum]AHW62698.1 Putative transcriptional regulator, GntR-family [Corynebacterium glyciniphilum AJ 3170]
MSDEVRNGALLAESVLYRLREEIISGTLSPGTPLSVPGIAARFDVSRSPVREAVQQLTVEGVAEYRPHAGARVAALDRGTLEQVFELREVLDGLAAGQATGEATTEDIAELRSLLDCQEVNLESPPDPLRDSRLDLDFHTRIREISGNRPLCDALMKLDIQGYLYRSDAWHGALNRTLSFREHGAIVDAIEAGDARAAATAASSHAGAVLVRILRG